METRRTPITKLPGSMPAKARRRSTMGMTRWFEIITATATESTMTMAVAAEKPPRKAMTAMVPALSMSGSASTVMSRSMAPLGKDRHTCERDRDHEDVDEDQIERKQPGGPLQVGDVVVLDHRDVKLTRQKQGGAGREQDQRDVAAEAGGRAPSGWSSCPAR